VYSLAFSLPGTPVLFYGEEIGMAENLAVEGRMSVRSPMQWSSEPQGGFTTAEESVRPVVADSGFSPVEVNVARQRREDDSLLNWMERLIRRRRECPELGWGESTLLDSGDAAVFAQRSDWEGSTVVAVHNLAGRKASTRLELGGEGALVDLFHDEERALDGGEVTIELPPYGAHWFRVRRPGQRLPP
jgi:glycosidase